MQIEHIQQNPYKEELCEEAEQAVNEDGSINDEHFENISLVGTYLFDIQDQLILQQEENPIQEQTEVSEAASSDSKEEKLNILRKKLKDFD